MSAEVMEEELLRSIEEVEDRIRSFRKRVRAVLASVQAQGDRQAATPAAESAT